MRYAMVVFATEDEETPVEELISPAAGVVEIQAIRTAGSIGDLPHPIQCEELSDA